MLVVLLGFGWWGRAALRIIFRLPFDYLHPTLHLLLGLTALITACNVASFFIRINIEVNIFFSLLAILGTYRYKREVVKELREWCDAIKHTHFLTKIAFAIVFLIALLKSVSPSEIEDEAGYYLPLIRWIENYSIVPGIANIEDRMGFNSSRFITDCFFSVSYLIKGGLYELNSFLFLMFNLFFLAGFDRLFKERIDLLSSDSISIIGFVFLWRSNLTSMDADYLNIQLGLLILVLLLRKIEFKDLFIFSEMTVLILVYFTLLLTVKFSSAMLGLPLILLLWSLFSKSKMKVILLSKLVIVASVIMLPWLCRNYFISGYPIFPLYFVKIGNPDWQVLPEIAKGQYEYIREYAKNEMECSVNDYRVDNLTLQEWVPYWLSITWKLLIGKFVLLGAPLATLMLLFIMSNNTYRKKWKYYLLLEALLLLTMLFWFFRLPSIRFFWGGLLVYSVLPITLLLSTRIQSIIHVLKCCIFFFIAFGLLRGITLSIKELPGSYYLLYPAKISSLNNFKKITLNGYVIRVSEDNQCHGEFPPCFPEDYLRGIQLRGKSIQSGFKVVQ
jgi:hypothetical protein